MSEENKALVRRMYDAIGSGDLVSIEKMMADDIVEHEVFPGLEPNKAGVIAFFKTMRSAFPDLSMSAEDVRAEGDMVVVRGVMRGTSKGEFMGMPPTGKPVAVPFADFLRIKEGKFVEHWGVTDTGVMMQQLGGA